jgi:hypothetical protein
MCQFHQGSATGALVLSNAGLASCAEAPKAAEKADTAKAATAHSRKANMTKFISAIVLCVTHSIGKLKLVKIWLLRPQLCNLPPKQSL